MAQSKRTMPIVMDRREGIAGSNFVSEYTAKRDIAEVVLTYAKQLGLIADDTMAAGSAGRYASMAPVEKEALSFEHVAELGKADGDPARQAATYRAAFKVGGAVVSELTHARLAQMERQGEYKRQRQTMIDNFAARPDVQEMEARNRALAQFRI